MSRLCQSFFNLSNVWLAYREPLQFAAPGISSSSLPVECGIVEPAGWSACVVSRYCPGLSQQAGSVNQLS